MVIWSFGHLFIWSFLQVVMMISVILPSIFLLNVILLLLLNTVLPNVILMSGELPSKQLAKLAIAQTWHWLNVARCQIMKKISLICTLAKGKLIFLGLLGAIKTLPHMCVVNSPPPK